MYRQVMIALSKNKNISVNVYDMVGMIAVDVFERKENGGKYKHWGFLSIVSFYIWLINQDWYNDKYTIDDLTNYFVSVPIDY